MYYTRHTIQLLGLKFLHIINNLLVLHQNPSGYLSMPTDCHNFWPVNIEHCSLSKSMRYVPAKIKTKQQQKRNNSQFFSIGSLCKKMTSFV